VALCGLGDGGLQWRFVGTSSVMHIAVSLVKMKELLCLANDQG
jgi:hypothetical protein